MSEEDFKAKYIKSFLEAYKSAVGFGFRFRPFYNKDCLLKKAKDQAEKAWQEYLKNH